MQLAQRAFAAPQRQFQKAEFTNAMRGDAVPTFKNSYERYTCLVFTETALHSHERCETNTLYGKQKRALCISCCFDIAVLYEVHLSRSLSLCMRARV